LVCLARNTASSMWLRCPSEVRHTAEACLTDDLDTWVAIRAASHASQTFAHSKILQILLLHEEYCRPRRAWRGWCSIIQSTPVDDSRSIDILAKALKVDVQGHPFLHPYEVWEACLSTWALLARHQNADRRDLFLELCDHPCSINILGVLDVLNRVPLQGDERLVRAILIVLHRWSDDCEICRRSCSLLKMLMSNNLPMKLSVLACLSSGDLDTLLRPWRSRSCGRSVAALAVHAKPPWTPHRREHRGHVPVLAAHSQER